MNLMGLTGVPGLSTRAFNFKEMEVAKISCSDYNISITHEHYYKFITISIRYKLNQAQSYFVPIIFIKDISKL